MNISTIKAESAFSAFDLNFFENHKILDNLDKRFLIIDMYSNENERRELAYKTFNELRSSMQLLLQKFNSHDDTFKTLDVTCFQSPKYLVYFLVNNTYLNFNTYYFEGSQDNSDVG